MKLTIKLIVIHVLVLTASIAQGDMSFRSRNYYGTNPNNNVDFIVVHAIGGPKCVKDEVIFDSVGGDADSWKKWFEKKETEVSIHYIVDRKGLFEDSTATHNMANHAKGHNVNSIGIELVNRGDGDDPYPDEQVNSLLELIVTIAEERNINSRNVVRHSDIDTRYFDCGGKRIKKKQDPGKAFLWKSFKERLATRLGDEQNSEGIDQCNPPLPKPPTPPVNLQM